MVPYAHLEEDDEDGYGESYPESPANCLSEVVYLGAVVHFDSALHNIGITSPAIGICDLDKRFDDSVENRAIIVRLNVEDCLANKSNK